MESEDGPVAGLVSFFAGCGILDLGLEEAGFRPWLANELHAPFREAYIYARQRMGASQPVRGLYDGGFEAFLESDWRRSALLAAVGEAREATGLAGFVGGPPCPDFSIAGTQAGDQGVNGRLTQHYADLICEVQPDFFVMENVRGLWSTDRHMEFYLRAKRQLQAAGYHTTDRLLNTLNFGVPQDRWRVIVVGFLGKTFMDPPASHMARRFPWDSYSGGPEPFGLPWPGQEAFSEDSVRPAPPGVPQELTAEWWFRRNRVYGHANAGHFFQPRAALSRFRSIPEGNTGGKSFKRLHRWRYSPTAAYGNNEVHLHPYKARRLSVAEAMAVQSFPAGFELPGDLTLSDMFKTVGNAVPFVFARTVGQMLRQALSGDLPIGATDGKGSEAVAARRHKEDGLPLMVANGMANGTAAPGNHHVSVRKPVRGSLPGMPPPVVRDLFEAGLAV